LFEAAATLMADKRRFTRIHFEAAATLRLDDEPHAVELLDISLHGALLRVPTSLKVAAGAPCVAELDLDGGNAVIRMEGHVSHVEGGAVGVACDHIDLDSITHLRRLVELNLGDEALLHRELLALWHAPRPG
jgi:hypothetical protein